MGVSKYEAILAMMQDMKPDLRAAALFGDCLSGLYGSWPENEQFEFFMAVEKEFYLQRPLMFCPSLQRQWPDGIKSVAMTNYLIKRITGVIVDYNRHDNHDRYSIPELSAVKWLYYSALNQSKDVSKVNHLVRLCGEKLDPFWVDNYCRRECVSAKKEHWEEDFRDLLANGMIAKIGYWQYYNLGSGVYLNQSKPEHYSREDWLKDYLYTLIMSCNIHTPDALKQITLYLGELTSLIGEKKVTAWQMATFGDSKIE